MRGFQFKGLVVVPTIIAFISLQVGVSLYGIEGGGLSEWIVMLLSLVFLVGIIKWFNQKEVLHLHMGFKDLPKELIFALHMSTYIGMIYLHSSFQPNQYMGISPVLMLLVAVFIYVVVIYLYQNIQVETVFMKITPTLYMDLTYFELHNVENIASYRGIKTLVEDLHVENLLMTQKHILKKKPEERTIHITEEDGFLFIQCYELKVLLWEERYKAEKLSKEELRQVEKILEKIA